MAEHWETEGIVDRQVLLREQVWEGVDMKVAWEQYYETQGYSPYARCAKQECHAEAPCVITKKPSKHRNQEWEELKAQWSKAKAPEPKSVDWGNSVKLKARLPVEVVEAKRRELLGFCHQCWRVSNFRGNNDIVACMAFMEKAGIFTERVINTTDRLRGKLTENEWQKFIQNFLKTGKAPGPDGMRSYSVT